MFMQQLETHLTFMYNAPPVILRILHIAIFIGFAGHLSKLFKPSESNLLFDGSSLVLYFIGVIIYLTNIAQGLKMVAEGDWDTLEQQVEARLDGDVKIGKEDSMRVLAASNTILALVLVGVLVLQAGQWYAEKREGQERKEWAEKMKQQQVAPEGEKKQTRSVSSKKKQ